MRHKKFNLVSHDGTFLIGRFWKPKEQPSAAICIVHGIGEHSERYDAWARHFCERGFALYAVDLRGHGLSEGKRGHIHHLHEFMDDIDVLVKRCKREQGSLPLFIYGHSMGGNLVLNFLLKKRQDFAGAIVTSPWLKLKSPPGPFLRRTGRIMNKIWPRFTVSIGISSSQLTSDKNEQEACDRDEWMHGRISLRLFNELDKASGEIAGKASLFEIPFFFAHGDNDEITDPHTTRQLAEEIGERAEFYNVQGALHEVHREPGAGELFENMVKWIDGVLKKEPHDG
ncbi:MAG: alpha/beta hydrolase [Marinilabiliaceae bacterium]